jgi:hypothetical protein
MGWPSPEGPSTPGGPVQKDPPRLSGRVKVTWPGPEGPSALEREGGGDVAWSRRTLRARVDRREEGGGGIGVAGSRRTLRA